MSWITKILNSKMIKAIIRKLLIVRPSNYEKCESVIDNKITEKLKNISLN